MHQQAWSTRHKVCYVVVGGAPSCKDTLSRMYRFPAIFLSKRCRVLIPPSRGAPEQNTQWAGESVGTGYYWHSFVLGQLDQQSEDLVRMQEL